MSKCNQCGVILEHINGQQCPLCYETIGGNPQSSRNAWYPSYEVKKTKPSKNLLFHLSLFLSIAVISICLFFNLIINAGNLWFLYVVGPVLYLFLLLNSTIFSKKHIANKILLQVVGMSSMLFLIDMLCGFHKWSVNIVIPILVIAATLLITVIIGIKKIRWYEYVKYIMVMIFLGFIPIILYLIGISNSIWASAITALYALLTLTGMFLFSAKFKNEFVRIFHF
ncbi:DUF6320 domain-containing protein [Bacillus chungangensis]|uniref:Phosphoglycerol transferase MdoB-like AlkP superfamily enzyme n=1 Tax=Bacillus chungangensis TaxID=587633 RepID=A0ABT9WNR3_9BACI|nr:DUF6320 domain-containing protein [Bacillus chungangensis]MDQ0174928.1 phosphoglycerol transferase MdoB-like AlkP superfamily enzyme [Bacillus chungangensis]